MSEGGIVKDVQKLTGWTGRHEWLYCMIGRLVYHWAFAAGEEAFRAFTLPTPPQIPSE